MNICIAYILVYIYIYIIVYIYNSIYIDEEGYVRKESHEGKQLFIDRMQEQLESNKNKCSLINTAFQGSGYDTYFTDYEILMWSDFLHDGSSDIQGSYLQHIILPGLANSMSIFRFFLTSQKASYAYHILNNLDFNDHDTELQKRYNISLLNPLSFRINKLTGGSVTVMEVETLKIKRFMKDMYGYRVNQLVIDFVKDREGKYWIRGVQAFTLEEVINAIIII